jgi:hypothetical protein
VNVHTDYFDFLTKELGDPSSALANPAAEDLVGQHFPPFPLVQAANVEKLNCTQRGLADARVL